MEKINNYTPEQISKAINSMREFELRLTLSTLYEQHFKMLEALKNVMLLNAVARQHISDVFFQEIEQTIKDCEL